MKRKVEANAIWYQERLMKITRMESVSNKDVRISKTYGMSCTYRVKGRFREHGTHKRSKAQGKTARPYYCVGMDGGIEGTG